MSHTVTDKAHRSERGSSNHYLAFEFNCMQRRKTLGGLRSAWCCFMYRGLSLTEGEEELTSGLHRQAASPRVLTKTLGRAWAEARRLHLQRLPERQTLAAPTWGGSLCPRNSGFCFVSGTGRAKWPQDICSGHRGWPKGVRTPVGHTFPRAPCKGLWLHTELPGRPLKDVQESDDSS